MSRDRRPGSYQRLLFPLGEEDLRFELERRSGMAVQLLITANRSSMVRVRRGGDGTARVRAHRVFLWSPKPVLRALGRFVRSPRNRDARETLSAFLRGEDDRVTLCDDVGVETTDASSSEDASARARRRRERLRTAGDHVDLAAVFDRVNRDQFADRVRAAIGWGRSTGRGPVRTIHFGSFAADAAGGIIRIHPSIDRPFVPSFFVEFIVFHEMLHSLVPIERGPDGRRVVHGPEFRELEERHPDYGRAKAWERDNLHRFLRAPGPGDASERPPAGRQAASTAP